MYFIFKGIGSQYFMQIFFSKTRQNLSENAHKKIFNPLFFRKP